MNYWKTIQSDIKEWSIKFIHYVITWSTNSKRLFFISIGAFRRRWWWLKQIYMNDPFWLWKGGCQWSLSNNTQREDGETQKEQKELWHFPFNFIVFSHLAGLHCGSTFTLHRIWAAGGGRGQITLFPVWTFWHLWRPCFIFHHLASLVSVIRKQDSVSVWSTENIVI